MDNEVTGDGFTIENGLTDGLTRTELLLNLHVILTVNLRMINSTNNSFFGNELGDNDNAFDTDDEVIFDGLSDSGLFSYGNLKFDL